MKYMAKFLILSLFVGINLNAMEEDESQRLLKDKQLEVVINKPREDVQLPNNFIYQASQSGSDEKMGDVDSINSETEKSSQSCKSNCYTKLCEGTNNFINNHSYITALSALLAIQAAVHYTTPGQAGDLAMNIINGQTIAAWLHDIKSPEFIKHISGSGINVLKRTTIFLVLAFLFSELDQNVLKPYANIELKVHYLLFFSAVATIANLILRK